MSKQQRERINFLGLLGIPTLIAIALLWSGGLLGFGIWSLIEKSRNEFAQPERLQPQSFSELKNVPIGVFSYGGSDVWAAIRLRVDSAIRSERPEFQLRYVDLNHDWENSFNDRLTFLQSARSLNAKEYEQARMRGLKLKQIPVAINGIVIAVNPQLNVSSLTLDQLRLIYTGKISNWKQLGGSDLKIQPYSDLVNNSDTAKLFVADILQGKAPAKNVKFVNRPTQALRQVASQRGGIYYASAASVVGQCSVKTLPLGLSGSAIAPYQQPLVTPEQCPARRNQINTKAFQTGQYPITHYLYVVINSSDRNAKQAGEAYANFLLTNQGQELIAKAGFVRLR